MIECIISKLREHDLLKQKLTLFDCCCGTGAVSNALKDYFKIILNDNLCFATIFSKGQIVKQNCSFEKLGFDPLKFFNQNEETRVGFFTKNYAPKLSGRMYFSDYNAGRIDYFRKTIQDWYDSERIDENEYCYLLCSLLESISKVANVAGVYGAYLKNWDPRALKQMLFIDANGNSEFVISSQTSCEVVSYNSNIEDIIHEIDCDVLYLDPPYTKNSYSVQYHLLETLVRDDNPILKGITGARKYDNISNAWSKSYEVEVLFEKVIAKTKAKYILFSYSSDGLMSKDFITNVLKRYCHEDTIEIEEIPYKKYRNHKTEKCDAHYEYLFYAEKKDYRDVEYCCPLNYMGGKTNVIRFIKPYLSGRTHFVDLMGGGFNVGINAYAYDKVLYNDINFKVVGLIRMFRDMKTSDILKFIDTTIKKYHLEKHQKGPYLQLRNDYNLKYRNESKADMYLYVLILFGFQQQIRFNSNYEFNNPIGESGYNDSIKEKIVSFSRRIKELDLTIMSKDFSECIDVINEDCVVYADPPYLVTLGSYNDGKRGFNGWNEQEEIRLLEFFDKILDKGCKLVVSNILEYKGMANEYLQSWISKRNVSVVDICVRKRNEVLIVSE